MEKPVFSMDEFADSAKYAQKATKKGDVGRGAAMTTRVRWTSREYLNYYAKKYNSTKSTYLDMILNRLVENDPEFQEYLHNNSEPLPEGIEVDEQGDEVVSEDDMEF